MTMLPSHNDPDCELITVRDLAALLKIHSATIWQRVALAEAGLPCGGFPRPLRIGPKTIRWRLGDVRSYLDGLAGGPTE